MTAVAARRDRLLTASEELQLARRIERGDTAAKDEMVARNLRLVYSLALRYRGRGVLLEDLVQEGVIGLVRAVERFDHRRGLRFSTYAAWWIRRSLRDALDAADTIRIPSAARQQLAAIRQARSELRRSGRGGATTDDVARRAGLSVRTVRALETAPYVSASLDEPVRDGTTLLAELIADDAAQDGSRVVEEGETRGQLWSMLRALPARQRELLLRRYGLQGDEPQSHEEIGAWLGVGEERSRQIERQALHWLREIASGAQLAA
jgi:RNA polymerase primary sigma factor